MKDRPILYGPDNRPIERSKEIGFIPPKPEPPKVHEIKEGEVQER